MFRTCPDCGRLILADRNGNFDRCLCERERGVSS